MISGCGQICHGDFVHASVQSSSWSLGILFISSHSTVLFCISSGEGIAESILCANTWTGYKLKGWRWNLEYACIKTHFTFKQNEIIFKNVSIGKLIWDLAYFWDQRPRISSFLSLQNLDTPLFKNRLDKVMENNRPICQLILSIYDRGKKFLHAYHCYQYNILGRERNK